MMREQLFRLRDCAPRSVWEARWCLFDFPEVCNLVDRGGGIVAVLYEDEARTGEWVAVLGAHGLMLEPLAVTALEKAA